MIASFSMRCAGLRCALAALIALAALGVSRPAAAQAANPSPAAMLLAKQLVDVKNVREAFQPIVRGVVQKTKDVFMQTNFMWAKDLNEVAANLEKEYDPRVTEIVDQCARFYATHFSEQELKDLLTFYQSPLGQKALVEEPKILDESMVFAGTWADNLSAEIITRMRAEMKKRGHDL